MSTTSFSRFSKPAFIPNALTIVPLLAWAFTPMFAWGEEVKPVVVASNEPFIEEIIVRGDVRQLAIDDTALSVTVIDPNDVRQTKVNHLEELLGWAPNVNFTSGASRGRYVQIRGVGERGQFAEPLFPSVGLLLDGVELSGIGAVATTFDTKQVEIFRGPQGTLYGATALAGLINVVTNEPTEDFSARVVADAANFNGRGIGAVVSGPLTQQLGGRLAVRSYNDDGFIDNNFLGVDNTNQKDELTLRAKLNWQPSDRTEVGLTFGFVDINNGYDAFALDNSRDTLSDEPGEDDQTSRYVNVRFNHELQSDYRLEGYVSYANSDIDYSFDEDWVFLGFDPDEFSSFDRYQRDRETLSYDLRLVAPSGGELFNRPLDWVVGAFGLNQDVGLQRTYTFLAEDLFSDFASDRLALYGEAGLQLTPALRFALGARVERYELDYLDSNAVAFDPTDTEVTGRAVLEYSTPSDNLIYASISRGYKTGGANTDGTLPAELREFDPETQFNFEVGYKGGFADGRGSVRATVFYQLRDDVQASSSLVLIGDAGNSEFIQFTGNAADGANFGLEVEATYALTDQVNFFATLGLLDTEFGDFINGNGENLDGREQAQSPTYQFFAGVNYDFAPGFFARLELEGKDSYFVSESNSVRAPSYELVNATLGYQGRNWNATVWGRNLGDQDVIVRGFFFGNDPRDGFTARPFTQLGEPRRYGVTIGLDF